MKGSDSSNSSMAGSTERAESRKRETWSAWRHGRINTLFYSALYSISLWVSLSAPLLFSLHADDRQSKPTSKVLTGTQFLLLFLLRRAGKVRDALMNGTAEERRESGLNRFVSVHL